MQDGFTGNGIAGDNLAQDLVAIGFVADTFLDQKRGNQFGAAVTLLALAFGNILVEREETVHILRQLFHQ